MNVPVVLPILRAVVGEDGTVSVTIDDAPYDPTEVTGRLSNHVSGRTITRGDLRQVIDEITGERHSAVRVEVTESNGTTYSDIATPPETDADPGQVANPDEPATPSARLSTEHSAGLPGVTGTGFRPGEQVAIAYVLMQAMADASGAASLRLPAAILANRARCLVLLGLDSKTIAPIATDEGETATL